MGTGSRIGWGIGTFGLSELARGLSGEDAMKEAAEKQAAELAAQRSGGLKTQYGLLDEMKAPEVSGLTSRRLAALDEESKPGPLVSDPLFQGDRSRLLHSGASELAGVGNRKGAYGIGQGGFSNVGSENDVADRMGANLAALGQQSRQVKEQKRDIAAQLQQSISDAQMTYKNSIIQAKMALQAGDSQAASMAIQQAYAARAAAENATRQMTGQLLGMAGTAAGAALGGPAGAQAGGQVGKAFTPPNTMAPNPAPPSYSSSPYSLGNYNFTSGLEGPMNQPYANWRT